MHKFSKLFLYINLCNPEVLLLVTIPTDISCFCSKTKQMHNISNLFYFGTTLNTCYTIQLMHYSHFKTQSLQHLKPIKCWKRVCKCKTPTFFGLFSRPSSGGPPLCFVRRTPWRWSWKKTETCRGFILTSTFSTFYWF